MLKIAIAVLGLITVFALAGVAHGVASIFVPDGTTAAGRDETCKLSETEALRATIEAADAPYEIIGNYLYYANPGHHFYMYRLGLYDFSHKLYLQMPVFDVITDGERLFFSAGEMPNVGIFTYCPAGGEANALAHNVSVCGSFRMEDGMIFFTDTRGEAQGVLVCGRQIVLDYS